MRPTLIFAIVSQMLGAAINNSARADFVENLTAWRKLNEAEKIAYAVAVWDTLVGFQHMEPIGQALARGLKDCAASTVIEGRQLVALIDRFYDTNENLRHNPPRAVLHDAAVHGPCRSYVNYHRRRVGLPQW